MTLGSLDPQSIGSFMSLLFTTPEGWTMIVGGNLVGLAFAALVLTVSAMSFPMLVDRPVDVGTAVATSVRAVAHNRSEEHTSELQSLMRISYAVFCLKKKKKKRQSHRPYR